MTQSLRLLAVLPHPDDESLGMGGALAKYAAEGIQCHLLCATRGERGWSGPPQENPGLEELGRIREAELRCAAETLGLHEVCFLGYIDGDVDQAEPQVISALIAAHMRRICPHVVITFSPDGIYGHPDHIALAQFTNAALVLAADGSFKDAERRPPWRVLKFYYMVDSRELVDAMHQFMGPLGISVDGVERRHVGWEEWAITTRIDVRDYFDMTWPAILCHSSQVAGFEELLEIPREKLLRIWGESTFVRVYSLVNGGRAVERDLFEGLR